MSTELQATFSGPIKPSLEQEPQISTQNVTDKARNYNRVTARVVSMTSYEHHGTLSAVTHSLYKLVHHQRFTVLVEKRERDAVAVNMFEGHEAKQDATNVRPCISRVRCT